MKFWCLTPFLVFSFFRKIDTKSEQFLTHAHTKKKVIVYFVTFVMHWSRTQRNNSMNECKLYVWYMKWSETSTGVRMYGFDIFFVFLISSLEFKCKILYAIDKKKDGWKSTFRTNVCHQMITIRINERLMTLKRCRFRDKALENMHR